MDGGAADEVVGAAPLSAAAAITLALGIGGNTAIFTVVDAVSEPAMRASNSRSALMTVRRPGPAAAR